MLTVAPARHRQVINPWLVVTICFSVAAGLFRGPSRAVSELQARGPAFLRIVAFLGCISTASGATGPPVITSQDHLNICMPGASSSGCGPGMSDLCILSDENQLPTTSFNHGSDFRSIDTQNISSASLGVSFTTGGYFSTLFLLPVGDDLAAPMGPELWMMGSNLMEYDLASGEGEVADTCSCFNEQVRPGVSVASVTDDLLWIGSLEGPRAVQRRPPAISWTSAHYVMTPVLCGNPGHACIQEVSSQINGVKFFTMTSPMNVTIMRSDPLGTEESGACLHSDASAMPPHDCLTLPMSMPLHRRSFVGARRLQQP